MRLFLGHKLPGGFYAGVSFNPSRHTPRSVVHADGSASELTPVPHWIVYLVTLITGFGFLMWLFR
jgi:hypothetical protein